LDRSESQMERESEKDSTRPNWKKRQRIWSEIHRSVGCQTTTHPVKRTLKCMHQACQ
jgi:hypothetical protein